MKIIFQALLLIIAASFLALLISVLSSERRGGGFISPISQKQVLKNSENQKVEIILTGDVMLGRSVMAKSLEVGDNTYPFRKVADVLRGSDLVLINLENPIVENCPVTNEGLKFCARPEMIEGLTFAGVDMVSLANNHSRNYSEEGLQETVETLKANGVDSIDGEELLVKEIGGTKFGFLGFDFTTKTPKEVDYNEIDFAASQVDVLITSVHWGIEYTRNPTNSQREWAKRMVNFGVDIVVGHGPHWVQDIEYIEVENPTSPRLRWARPVYYSLGNFIFDQMWSEETKKGLAIRLTFQKDKIIKEEKLPTYMSSWAQPEFIVE